LMIAKAAEESVKAEFGGHLHGYANNKSNLAYYEKQWNGEYIGQLHPYHFEISEKSAQELIRKFSLKEGEKKDE